MTKVKIGDITESCLGKMLDAKKNKGEYQPYLANLNVRWGSFDLNNLSLMRFEKKEQERYSLKYEDLVMCEGGEPGRCAIWKDEIPGMKIQKALHRIRPHSCVNVHYMYYWFLLASRQGLLERYFIETTIKHLTGEKLREIEIDLPDISIQENLIGILCAFDKKIELNNKINIELEAMAKTIYDYWFVQFDFPDENGKPYRSSGGEMVWNEKLKREIPKGWKVQNIAKNSLSKLIKPGVDTFEVKTYLATADVNGTSFGDGNPIEFETRENRANMQPSINSVWFAKMKNSVKHLFLNEAMSEFIESTILSTGFCGIQCTETGFEYIASYISSPQFEITKDTLAHGATQQAVNNNDLLFIKIVIPNDETLKLFHQSTKAIYGKISANIKENQELTNLRDWLLPMLMNGQITVGNNV